MNNQDEYVKWDEPTNEPTKFGEFLNKISQMELPTNTTSKGETTIQQTPRNELSHSSRKRCWWLDI